MLRKHLAQFHPAAFCNSLSHTNTQCTHNNRVYYIIGILYIITADRNGSGVHTYQIITRTDDKISRGAIYVVTAWGERKHVQTQNNGPHTVYASMRKYAAIYVLHHTDVQTINKNTCSILQAHTPCKHDTESTEFSWCPRLYSGLILSVCFFGLIEKRKYGIHKGAEVQNYRG